MTVTHLRHPDQTPRWVGAVKFSGERDTGGPLGVEFYTRCGRIACSGMVTTTTVCKACARSSEKESVTRRPKRGRQPLPANLAVLDRISPLLVAFALDAVTEEQAAILAPRTNTLAALGTSRLGLTADEIAACIGGDVNLRGDRTGWDQGQRCYRYLRRLIDQGLVARTPPGGSPVFYWATQQLIDDHAAAVDQMPPLVTTKNRNP